MALVQETELYKYKITLLEILIPGKDTINVLPANINSIGIEKDFDNDHFPILYLNMNMGPEIYYDILENKTTVKFRVRLDTYVFDTQSVMRKTHMVFNDLFSIFTDDNSAFVNKDLYKKTKDITGESTPMTDFATPREFFLFKENDLIASKKVTNGVVKSGNMTTVSTFLLSTSGISKVLMTPLDNNATYYDVLLPPISLIQNIKYLEKQYGLYYHGLMLFFDFERAYFINRRSECTAWEPGEFKDVVIECFKGDKASSMTSGSYRDEDKKTYFIHVTNTSINMSTSSVIDDQLSGNNMVVIDSGTGKTTTVNPKVQQRGDGTTKVLVDNLNNPFTKKSMEYRKKENDSIISINVQNVDMRCFTPNKKFKFVFEDTEIQKTRGGSYRLCGAVYTFDKQGNEFASRITAKFKKID